MKRLVFISFVALSMTAGSAMAQQGDVKFFGSVSATTCNLTPQISGTVGDTIQLGTVTPNGTGSEIPFALKASSTAGGCASLSNKTADITWSGQLTEKGFANQGGVANDSYVALKTVNGKTQPAQEVKASNSTVNFDASKATTEGFKFTAQLKGGQTPGDFQGAAAYAVTYK
ncbi:F18 fimbrial major subunit FedA (plasmid) [Escherichia coli]|nr:F18 fimbrial major subunit FedA [Escherichia coli]WHG71434.1 F18 fimbrial major subunit FedA [Escherichia coli]